MVVGHGMCKVDSRDAVIICLNGNLVSRGYIILVIQIVQLYAFLLLFYIENKYKISKHILAFGGGGLNLVTEIQWV